MTSKYEKQILTAWNSNASRWIRAVEQAGIRAPGNLSSSSVLRVIEDYAPRVAQFSTQDVARAG